MPRDGNGGGRPVEATRKILHGLLAHGPATDIGTAAAASRTSDKSWKQYVGLPESRTPKAMRVSRLVEFDADKGGYHLGPGLGLVLSFSVGGEHLIAALVDAGGRVHCIEPGDPFPRQLTQPPPLLLRRMRILARRVIQAGLDEGLACPTADGGRALRLIGATVSWPAPMGYDSSPLGGPINDAWHEATFREHLHATLGLPLDRCHAMNDANAGAMTMAFEQQTPRAGAVMCLHLSAGIGLGTVHQAIPAPDRLAFVDAHLVGGRDGRAGEVGHCVIPPGIVDHLNAASATRREQYKDIKPLDAHRPCDCDPAARGHLEAVVGAEAVLDRLNRYANGDSLVERLNVLHAEAATNSLARLALKDAGRAVGSVLTGVVAATDPVSITVVGALASDLVVEGLNQQLEGNGVPARAKLYEGEDPQLVGLRGAALAVLRGGVYRGFFNNIVRAEGSREVRVPEDWAGWYTPGEGAQSGATSRADSVWQYRPMPINEDYLEMLDRLIGDDPL